MLLQRYLQNYKGKEKRTLISWRKYQHLKLKYKKEITREFLSTQRQESSVNATERRLKRFKRQKLEVVQNDVQNGNTVDFGIVSQINHEIPFNIPPKDANLEDCLVNWMSMDETQFSQIEKLKGDDSAADCNDTDDTDEEDECVEVDNKTDHNNGQNGFCPCGIY
ncbi:hypothetical protein OIU74_002972 [Salix koriyanagi]|uniref:Uncharacterized protein n=1 Tax=Salix koriyanagi TaxID=2511006 RepID=A0A9Q0UYA6_9ROSI|nr:hypothetical protein OIU74_002972 [Salix koriyanagi]